MTIPKYLSPTDLPAATGLPYDAILDMRKAGTFCPPQKIGNRDFWIRSELKKWMMDNNVRAKKIPFSQEPVMDERPSVAPVREKPVRDLDDPYFGAAMEQRVKVLEQQATATALELEALQKAHQDLKQAHLDLRKRLGDMPDEFGPYAGQANDFRR